MTSAGQPGTSVSVRSRVDYGSETEKPGRALFDTFSFKDWSDVLQINTAAVYFTTTAFTALLVNGAKANPSGSSVVNISSVAGQMKSVDLAFVSASQRFFNVACWLIIYPVEPLCYQQGSNEPSLAALFH